MPLIVNWSNVKDPASFFTNKHQISPFSSHLAIIGAQWGDEGKGKIVDYIAHQFNYNIIARFAGGNNAGHTIYCNEQKHHFSLLPVSIINPHKQSIIGRNCLLNLSFLVSELRLLTKHQEEINLVISPACHLIMPYHLLLDQQQENKDRANQPIGTTKRGIGPCLQDKVGRFGIQLQDLFDLNHFRNKLAKILANKNHLLTTIYQQKSFDLETMV